jgi:DNA-binding MarR family transcriptional regulator
MSKSYDFARAPGHLIRRAQQIAVAEFARELAACDITPVQFALLNAMIDTPGVDQVTLANGVAFDAATSGSVIGRLEAKGWVRREPDPHDRRRKLLFATPEGKKAVHGMKEAVDRVQHNILAPLAPREREVFMRLLAALVAGHEQSTPPSDA